MAYISVFWRLNFENFLFWIYYFQKRKSLIAYKLFLEARITFFPFWERFDGLCKQIM